MTLVCGEWNIGEEPELSSEEEEVVLPINKFINHPSYKDGPGEGYDISLYFVDDAKLKKQGVVKEGVLYPACLPQNGDLIFITSLDLNEL